MWFLVVSVHNERLTCRLVQKEIDLSDALFQTADDQIEEVLADSKRAVHRIMGVGWIMSCCSEGFAEAFKASELLNVRFGPEGFKFLLKVWGAGCHPLDIPDHKNQASIFRNATHKSYKNLSTE